MSRHYITQSYGFGCTDSLADRRRMLAWYERHPKIAATPRGVQHVATLQRDIAALEAAQQPSPALNLTNH